MKDQLEEGLKTMRKLHLIHGDIKPINIMYSPWQGKIVLIDFGLARFIKKRIN